MSRAVPSTRALHEGLRLSMPMAATLHDTLGDAHIEGDAAVEDALRAANRFMGGHGVEAINDERGPHRAYWWCSKLHYVNMGDTYDRTLGYDVEKDAFVILLGGWGDWLERYERDVGYELS